MSAVISVLSKIPNLRRELQNLAPNLLFKEITAQNQSELSKSEIIIADFDILISNIDKVKRAKLIQGTWAGINQFLPYFTPENFPSTVITRFSGKHFGRLMSEYVVANIINHERKFFEVYENKKQKIWTQNGGISQHRSIADLSIGVLGIGHIGNHIAKMLHNFGAKIWGFGRKNVLPTAENYKHFHEYCTVQSLPKLLKNCDYIVNVLPSTNDTMGLLNGNILQICENKNTVFINIGRGNIIDEKDLLNALKNKWLSAAILDVFDEEPLTKESALWDREEVFITPHVAGVSRAKDIAEQFLENYNLYKNNQKISTQLFFENTY